ncbi:unnamed protein product [Cochlearia groenlandica]
MLLRSASNPILNSLTHVSSPRDSQIDADSVNQIQRQRSFLLSSSSSLCFCPMSLTSSDGSTRKMKKTASETDLIHLLTSTKKPSSKFLTGALLEDGIGFGLIRNSSHDFDLGFNWALDEDTEVTGGGGGGGGMFHGGGKGRSGRDGGGDGDGPNQSTEAHYREMIEANPSNGLILSNYAKFLKEVCKDYAKAEEYCERALLVNGNDGNVLAMYAELVWTIHKDSSRAETYFNQAVIAAPNDCYVQAAYARFLWDSEEEEEEEEERHEEESEYQTSRMSFLAGHSPIEVMS